MVICLERGAGLHIAQLMPLPLTVSFFSEIQIGFTFLVLAHPGSSGQRAIKRMCACACVYVSVCVYVHACSGRGILQPACCQLLVCDYCGNNRSLLEC